ncbi:MAG: protoporphyrinogen oxidase HemJ [Arcobacteraceae bacterium]
MSEYYYPILAFHIVAVLSWISMLFYLPRLFVYHQENKDKNQFVEVVKIQEYKLYTYIGAPAMWATLISGAFLLFINPELLKQGWMHAKLFILVLLIIYSFSLEYYRKQLESDSCPKSGKFFRAYNEVPTIFAILIVTFVITKSIPIYFSVGITLFFVFIMYMIVKAKPKKTDKKEQ